MIVHTKRHKKLKKNVMAVRDMPESYLTPAELAARKLVLKDEEEAAAILADMVQEGWLGI